MPNAQSDYDRLRAILAEYVVNDDRLDIIMEKMYDISDHVFGAIMEQIDLGNDGSWKQFEKSKAYTDYLKILDSNKSVAWVFEWLYKTIGENNIDYIKEVYDG